MNQVMKNDKYHYVFKLVTIGDSGVGKTQLISRYTTDKFNPYCHTTLGVEFITHAVTINNKHIGAQIWDTTGQEKFQSLTTIYYKGAVGAILVYDITRRGTFDRISNQWLAELRNFSDPHMVVMLIGNKCDLKDERQVNIEDAKAFAEAQSK